MICDARQGATAFGIIALVVLGSVILASVILTAVRFRLSVWQCEHLAGACLAAISFTLFSRQKSFSFLLSSMFVCWHPLAEESERLSHVFKQNKLR